jgi:hypothetical protein
MIVKNFVGVESIKIESSAKVSILRGKEFRVSISGDDAAKVEVSQSRSEISIQYVGSGSGNGVTIISGGNVMSVGNVSVGGNTVISSGGKNISIVNGEVFINGKRVDENGTTERGPAQKPVEIEIQCPDGLSIDCTLIGIAILGAKPEFHKARIAVKGQGQAGLQAHGARLKITGSGEIHYKSLGGSTKMNIAGSGDIYASGLFSDVEASIAGSGDIHTDGSVSGDYEADISGSGFISHRGAIAGRKDKSVSGTGSVRW